MTATILQADTLDWSRQQPDDSVDLVLCSPPYENARLYGEVGFKLKGQDWVDWAFARFVEHYRICRGLVAWVVSDKTEDFRWSAAVACLIADLTRADIHLRRPPLFHRIGICGSGGPDWLRNDYEFVVCASKGKLPWSDNTAMGHPPKWAPGGDMSHRLSDGTRRNQWGGSSKSTGGERKKDGTLRVAKPRPSHRFADKLHTKTKADGSKEVQGYTAPAIANPGNIIQRLYTADEVANLLAEASSVTHHVVGGGCMGDDRAHENEAPYPESVPEFFIRSFCPPGGKVYDGFCGSGTTPAVAKRLGRIGIGTDVRESQVELTKRRLAEVQLELIA